MANCRVRTLEIFNIRFAWSIQMLDIIMLTIGLGVFVLTVGYAYACNRL